jgi:hypothetical protein
MPKGTALKILDIKNHISNSKVSSTETGKAL